MLGELRGCCFVGGFWICDVRVFGCWESGGGAVMLGVCVVCDVRKMYCWES